MIVSPKDFVLGKNLYRSGKKQLIYCRFVYKNKDVRRSTGKLDLKQAQSIAWSIYCEIAGLSEQKVELRRSTYPTVEEIKKIYTAEIPKYGRCSASSAKKNVNALLLILKRAGLPLNPRIDRIDSDVVKKWREFAYLKNDKIFGVDKDLNLNTTLNSSFTQAKSIFSKAARRLYKEKNIKLPPCIQDFLDAPMLEKASSNFVAIPQRIDKTIKQLAQLAFESKEEQEKQPKEIQKLIPSKEIAVAVELARRCGLTSKEIVGIRWEWFEEKEDTTILSIRHRPATAETPEWTSKGNKKNGDLAIDKELLEKWKHALGALEKTKGYLFDLPSDNLREAFVQRNASQWIRQFIPDRIKSLHELRKQAGSEVASKHGLLRAAEFLRDSYAVAEKYYITSLNPPKAL